MSAHDDLLSGLRRRLDETRDIHREEPRKGLEDLADRNPALRARVDALRAEVPTLPVREVGGVESENEGVSHGNG